MSDQMRGQNALASTRAAQIESETRPPNVVVCLSDQLRAFEVGCYGNAVVQTPNIDALARNGVRFETAVTNNPVCMPARSSLLSGQYSRTCIPRINNYTELDSKGKPFLPQYPKPFRTELLQPTLADCFQAKGYDTALIGKWHVQPAPHLAGFDHAIYPLVQHRHTSQSFVENSGVAREVEGVSMDFEAAHLEKYLGAAARKENPFFLFLNISPPHMPFCDAPKKYLEMYRRDEVSLRPNVFQNGQLPFDETWFKIYRWGFLFYEQRLPHTLAMPPDFDLRDLTALYYGMTSWTDDAVGNLMRVLAANGLDENTLVVFAADHGDNLGSHAAWNKDALWEESIRVPLVFHAPHRFAPRVNDSQVAQLIDLLPTLGALCELETPAAVQGRDLSPILNGQRETLEEAGAFIETSDGKIGFRAPQHLFGMQLAPGFREIADEDFCFYDLRDDPYQMKNLAGARTQRETAAAMKQKLRDWTRDTPWFGA